MIFKRSSEWSKWRTIRMKYSMRQKIGHMHIKNQETGITNGTRCQRHNTSSQHPTVALSLSGWLAGWLTGSCWFHSFLVDSFVTLCDLVTDCCHTQTILISIVSDFIFDFELWQFFRKSQQQRTLIFCGGRETKEDEIRNGVQWCGKIRSGLTFI